MALSAWLSTEPREPTLQIEGIVRTFFADQGSPEQLVEAMAATARSAREMLDELLGYVDEYLAPAGPLEMLEQGRGGRDGEREEFHGRPMYPERLHVVAMSIDVITQVLGTIEAFFSKGAAEVSSWRSTTDVSLSPSTRRRLERIRHRGAHSAPRR